MFTTTLPTQGVGKLKNREDMKLVGSDKESSLFVPENNWYKDFALGMFSHSTSFLLMLQIVQDNK